MEWPMLTFTSDRIGQIFELASISGTKLKNSLDFGRLSAQSVRARVVCQFFNEFYCLLLGPFVHLELQFLFSKDLLPAHKFKIHFEYCCCSCGKETQDRVAKFKSLWIGAAKYYSTKWTEKWMKKYLKELKKGKAFILLHYYYYYSFSILFTLSYCIYSYHLHLGKKPYSKKDIRKHSADRFESALLEFLEPIASDCEYFVWNQRTFGNESFHSLCNRYYEKGSVVSFDTFVMKRQFAMLDWNEMMRKKSEGEEDSDIQDWQVLLLSRLRKALGA
jgi:hypothetical protein